MESSGKLKTINELDPNQNQLDRDNLTKFLNNFDQTYTDRKRPKGPDYLIIDNFLEIFEDLEKTDLVHARGEAEKLSSEACAAEEPAARCDALLWLKALDKPGKYLPAFRKIAAAMASFRPYVN